MESANNGGAAVVGAKSYAFLKQKMHYLVILHMKNFIILLHMMNFRIILHMKNSSKIILKNIKFKFHTRQKTI